MGKVCGRSSQGTLPCFTALTLRFHMSHSVDLNDQGLLSVYILFIYFFICTLGILGFRTGIYYIDFLLWSKTFFIYLEISLEKEGLSYLKIRTCHLDSFYFLYFWVHLITSIVKYINIYKSSIKRKIPT